MRYLLLFCTFLILAPQTVYAEVKRLTILEFQGVDVQDEGLFLSLSDGVRSGLVKVLDKDKYLIMTRESTLQILKDQGKDASCIAGSCEIEVARNVGADYVISGMLTKISGRYLVTLKLHKTESAALLASDQIDDSDAFALLKKMPIKF